MRAALFSVLVLAPVPFACAGYDWRTNVVRQASFDHGCPAENVQIVADNGDPLARSVQMNVCGRPRMYRDIGGERMYVWQDMTEMTGPPPTPAPTAQPVAAAPSPAARVEAVIRQGLDQRRDAILQCTQGNAVEVQAVYTADGSVDFRLRAPWAGSAAEACVRSALGEVRLDTQGAGGVSCTPSPPARSALVRRRTMSSSELR